MKKVILLACVMVVNGFASCAEYRRLYDEAYLKYLSPKFNCSVIFSSDANTSYCKNLKNEIAKYKYLIDECNRRGRQERQQDELQRKLDELDRKLNELNRQ